MRFRYNLTTMIRGLIALGLIAVMAASAFCVVLILDAVNSDRSSIALADNAIPVDSPPQSTGIIAEPSDITWIDEWPAREGDGPLCPPFAVDSGDSLLLIGQTKAATGGTDIQLLKYDKDGVFQWRDIRDNGLWDEGRAVAVDSANNVFAIGSTSEQEYDREEQILLKYDSSGRLQWQQRIRGSSHYAHTPFAVDEAGNTFVASEVTAEGSRIAQTELTLVAANGKVAWTRNIAGEASYTPEALAIDGIGRLILTVSRSEDRSSGHDLRELRLYSANTAGELQEIARYCDERLAILYTRSLHVLPETFYISAEISELEHICWPGMGDYLLLNYSDTGELRWASQDPQSDVLTLPATQVDRKGNVYCAGWHFYADAKDDDNDWSDVVVSKCDQHASQVWRQYWDTGAAEQANALAVDGLGNAVVAGRAVENLLAMKYSPLGELLWERQFDAGEGHYILLDSEDCSYIYAVQEDDVSTVSLVKLSSSGELVWQKSWERYWH